MPFVRWTIYLHQCAESQNWIVLRRAGLKPMQPMQLHWAPRHGVWVDYSFLPDTPCAW